MRAVLLVFLAVVLSGCTTIEVAVDLAKNMAVLPQGSGLRLSRDIKSATRMKLKACGITLSAI